MSSAVSWLRPVLCAPTDAAELFCAVKGPPGPTMMSPARQALKRSKPSLAGLSHAISDNDDDNEECVVWW